MLPAQRRSHNAEIMKFLTRMNVADKVTGKEVVNLHRAGTRWSLLEPRLEQRTAKFQVPGYWKILRRGGTSPNQHMTVPPMMLDEEAIHRSIDRVIEGRSDRIVSAVVLYSAIVQCSRRTAPHSHRPPAQYSRTRGRVLHRCSGDQAALLVVTLMWRNRCKNRAVRR